MSRTPIYNPCLCGSGRAYRFCCRPYRSGPIPEDVARPPVYLRFVTHVRDPWSRCLQGVIHSAADLRGGEDLTAGQEAWLEETFDWFNANLHVPKCLKEEGNDRAICWFHPRARRPIARMWDLVALLREHGRHVRLLTTRSPGLILYRDGWQVVAKPGRGRGTCSWR